MTTALALAAGATALAVVATAALVVAERRGDQRTRAIAKTLAAAAFVAVALAGGALARDRYGGWIVLGLALGAGGDVALLGRRRPAFVTGMALFLAGHLAYVAAALTLGGPAAWLPWPAAIASAIAVAVLAWLLPHVGPAAPAPPALVVAYVAIAVTMALAAVAPALAGAPGPRPLLLAIGAIGFLASDLAVARQRFVAASFWNKAWGLPLYVAAQLLIAWSTIAG